MGNCYHLANIHSFYLGSTHNTLKLSANHLVCKTNKKKTSHFLWSRSGLCDGMTQCPYPHWSSRVLVTVECWSPSNRLEAFRRLPLHAAQSLHMHLAKVASFWAQSLMRGSFGRDWAGGFSWLSAGGCFTLHDQRLPPRAILGYWLLSIPDSRLGHTSTHTCSSNTPHHAHPMNRRPNHHRLIFPYASYLFKGKVPVSFAT